MLQTLVFPTITWGGWTLSSLKVSLVVRCLILSPWCWVLNTLHSGRDLLSAALTSRFTSLCSHISRYGVPIPSRGSPFHSEKVWVLEGITIDYVEIFLQCHQSVQSLFHSPLTGYHGPWKGPKTYRLSFKLVMYEAVQFLNRGGTYWPSHTHQSSSQHRFCGF